MKGQTPIFLLVFFTFTTICYSSPVINSIWPRKGSHLGGARVELYGKNFAEDLFSGNNEITFGGRPYGNLTYNHIGEPGETCRKHPFRHYDELSQLNIYNAETRITTNGKTYSTTSGWKTFDNLDNYTPKLNHFFPSSASNGDVIEVWLNDINNWNPSVMQRIMIGNQVCELINPETNMNYGYSSCSGRWCLRIKCRVNNLDSGLYNVKVTTSDFGVAWPTTLSFQILNDCCGFAHIEIIPNIVSVSPSQGSILGGTRVSINGDGFGDDVHLISVNIGDIDCSIQSVSNSEIVCVTGNSTIGTNLNESIPYPGGHGVTRYSYQDIPTIYLAMLRESSKYPDNPDGASILPWFESHSTTFLSKYGERFETFFTPCSSGLHSFIISGDDQHELFFSESRNYSNLRTIASSDSYSQFRDYRTRSSKLMLNSNHSYLLVAEFKENYGADYITVGVIKHDTELTYFDTEQVSIENQTVSIRTDYLQEVQSLSINISNTLNIQDNLGFTLSLGGKSTLEINGLSLLMSPNQECYNEIYGIDYRGNVSTTREGMTCQNWNHTSPNTLMGNTETNGVGDHNYCRNPNNSTGGPWCYFESTTGWDYCNIDYCIKDALLYLFTAQCTGHEYDKANDILLFNFEDDDILIPNNQFSFVQDSITLTDSYCGRNSFRFQTSEKKLYTFNKDEHLPSISDALFLCMAYKIPQDHPLVISFEILEREDYYRWFSFISSSSSDLVPTKNTIVHLIEPLYDDSNWHYGCFDIYNSLQHSESPLSMEILHLVRKIELQSMNTTSSIYIDVLSLSYDTKLVTQIDPAIHPNGIIVSDITIESDKVIYNTSTLTSFNFSFTTTDCTSGIPLIDVIAGVATNDTLLVETKRIQNASQPIRGNFSIMINSSNIYFLDNIQYDANAMEVLNLIEDVFDVGNAKGGIAFSENLCRERKFWISFYSLSGDLDPVIVDSSNLSGNNVSIEVNEVTPGGLIIAPIPGSMLRTVNRKPQIVVKKDSMYASCKGPYTQDQHNLLNVGTSLNWCDYSYSNASQPLITSISPNNTCVNTLLTITGTSFGYSSEDISVLIGSSQCNINSISNVNITCIVPHSVGGLQRVVLTKFSYGNMPSNVEFEVNVCFTLVNISHTVGSVRGELLLTIEASNGFIHLYPPEDMFSMQIEMANSTCRIVSSNHTHVECLTPPSISQTVNITVKLLNDGLVIASDTLNQGFTYSLDDTPNVTSISRISGSILGGDTVTLFLTFLPSGNYKVLFDEYSVDVLSFNSTSITISTPPHSPRNVKVEVLFDSIGLVNADVYYEYIFYICNVSHSAGSLFGGQSLTFTGMGFSTDMEIIIDSKKCDIQSISNTEVMCTTQSTRSSYSIHRNVVGYYPNTIDKWAPSKLYIYPGDEVVWSWSNIILNEYPGVFLTSSPSAISPQVTEIQSGKSSSATYQHSFQTPGNFFYIAGTEVINNISHPADCYLKGEAYIGKISITNSFIPCLSWTAQYVTDNYEFNSPLLGDHNYCRNPNADPKGPWCVASDTKLPAYCNIQKCGTRGLIVVNSTLPEINAEININLKSFQPNIFASCEDVDLETSPLSQLNYSYLPSNTPQVMNVLTDDVIIPGSFIELVGINFATTDASIRVQIGQFNCSSVSLSNEDSIQTISCIVPYISSGNYRISIYVENIGWAFFWNDSHRITVCSTIMYPPSQNDGSIFGGSLLTIYGQNFDSTSPSDYGILIGNTPCMVQDIVLEPINSQNITCLTQAAMDDGYSALILSLYPISYWTFDNLSDIITDSGYLMHLESKIRPHQYFDESHMNFLNELHHSIIFHSNLMETDYHPAYANFEAFGIELWIRLASPKLDSIIQQHPGSNNQNVSTLYDGYRVILENTPYSDTPAGYRLVLNPCNRIEVWIATGRNETEEDIDECMFNSQLNCSSNCSGIRRVYSMTDNDTYSSWYIISGPELNTSSLDWIHISFGWEILEGPLNRIITDPSNMEQRSQCIYELNRRMHCNGQANLFVNGVVHGRENTTYSPGLSVSKLTIGGTSQLVSNNFNNFTGIMDEVVVHTHPLTQEEAQLHYNVSTRKQQIISVYSSSIDYLGTGVTPDVQYPNLSGSYNDTGYALKPTPSQHYVEWKIQSFSTLTIYSNDFVIFHWKKIASLIEINEVYFSTCDDSILPLRVLSNSAVEYVVNVSLETGDHYFTSDVEGHCNSEMKILIIVHPRPPLTTLVTTKFLSSNLIQGYTYLYPELIITNVTSNQFVGTSLNITLTGEISGTDNFIVIIGQELINDFSITNNTISCIIPYLAAGIYDLYLEQINFGYIPFNSSDGLVNSRLIQIAPNILSSIPNSGSLRGGTILTISGTGFSDSIENINITGINCELLESNLTTIMCRTLSDWQYNGEDIFSTFSVSVNGILSQSNNNFTFLYSDTPMISSLSALSGDLTSIQNGSVLIINGSLLTEDSTIRISSQTNPYDPNCYMGGAECPTASYTDGELRCTVPVLPGGMYTIIVHVPGLGYASEDSLFTPTFNITHSISSVSPSTIGTGGGVVLTISGTGFITMGVSIAQCNNNNQVTTTDQNQVSICSSECEIIDSTESIIRCIAPSSLNDSLHICNITVSSELATSHLSNALVYNPNITPIITNFSPMTGGTAGGTVITIHGSGFQDTRDSFQFVIVGSSNCSISSWNNYTIICITSSHSTNLQAVVNVFVTEVGYALPSSQSYAYIDRWSSNFTWGGESPPREGETVYIPKQFIVLLDISPPPLNLILIEGKLIFEDTLDISLQAKYIVINGGHMQIGTEEEPFSHEAVITLYGNILDPEIPLYGAKVLAIRQGGLEMHGIRRSRTWTRLSETAHITQNYIKVLDFLDWKIGDNIVIAPTSKDSNETEERMIVNVIDNGYTIILDQPLAFSHLGITETYSDDRFIELRAEVGLLSHNIKIQGSRITQSDPRGIESDLYGGHFMVFRPKPDPIDVRISYVEFRFMGQAFRLGRYAIHFHLSDRMNGSYVRFCSIHHSFNRAITAHGVENMVFEGVVAFDIQGHAFFIEDGIEIGNSYINNLGILIRGSSSLLNTDSIPAVFWITNPNNTFEGNSAVGSRAYGFWYDLDPHPSGPSQTDSVCPNRDPFGGFMNNIAHSNAEFGLRIWETYDPHVVPCSSESARETITLYNLTSYSNGIHGVEFSVIGNIQVDGFKLADNRDNGIEITETVGDCFHTEIKNTIIISRTNGNSGIAQAGGIRTIRRNYLRISNVTFINFNEENTVCMRACSHCKEFQGGFIVEFQGITFIGGSEQRKAAFQWEHEVVYIDLDGTFTGSTPGSFVIPNSAILPTDYCNLSISEFSINSVIPGAMCSPDVRMLRLAFNHVEPENTFEGRDATLNNSFGTTIIPWRRKRLTHSNGYMALIPSNYSYTLNFTLGDDTNTDVTSYKASIYHMMPDDYITISEHYFIQPNHFNMRDETNNVNNRNATLNNSIPTPTDNHLDWHFDNYTNTLTYLLKGESDTQYCSSRSFSLTSEPCPVDEDDVAHCEVENPLDGDYETNPRFWSNPEDWPSNLVPQTGEDVIIESTWRMHLNVTPPNLGTVYVYGELTFDDIQDVNFTAHIILIQGPNAHLIIGTAQYYFTHKVIITLTGDRYSEEVVLSRTMNLGSKAIGIFGNASLYGRPRGHTWLKLSETAEPESTEIHLDRMPLDWNVGDTIVIAPTGYNADNTETATIASISDNTITLVNPLENEHLVQPLLSNEARNDPNNIDWGNPLVFAAEVGLLSRNIIIQGGEDAEESLNRYHFGCRIFTGEFSTFSTEIYTYTGHFELDSIEIRNCGQGGFFSSRDPRYSFAVKNGGDNMGNSFITNSAIHHGYNTGIGIHATNGIRIQNNVVHRTVDSGIRVGGRSNVIEDNLVILVSSVLPDDPKDKHAVDFPASFEIQGFHYVRRNIAAGSYRLGFQLSGESCLNTGTPMIEHNLAHTTWTGMLITGISENCTTVNSFTSIWAWNYGIFSQTVSSLSVSQIVIAVGKIGLNLNILGPDPIQHLLGNKYINIVDSLIIGSLPNEQCDYPLPDYFPENSIHAQGTKSGIMMSYMNRNPFKIFKRWHKANHYPVIDGDCLVSNVTFANFQNRDCSFPDFAITNNPMSPDAVTPITIQRSNIIQVDYELLMHFYPPNVAWIVQEDCVDMDCDGPKHALVRDIDGTFTSNNNISTSLIPFAEIRFDETKIPRTWRYDPMNDLLLDASHLAPPSFRGIARGLNLNDSDIDSSDRGCQYVTKWNGYICNNMDHYVLVIESMDTDTEIRRLSPIALNGGDIGNGKYTDLINGPMDHGWCTSYTCLKRLSTFFTIVASGTEYTIWLTSTTPSHIRFHLLNSDGVPLNTDPGSVIINIWYKDTRRKDTYLNGEFVTPLNQREDGYRYLGDQYIPNHSQPSGSNYYNYEEQIMHLLVKGNTPVSIKAAAVIQLTFSLSVTLEQFFDASQFLNNLVGVLNIDENTIRVVNVISESRRRKRQSDGDTTVKIEIGEAPVTSIEVPQTPSSQEQFETNEGYGFNSIDDGANDTVTDPPTEQPPTLAPIPTTNIDDDDATVPSARDFIEEYENDVNRYQDDLLGYEEDLAKYNELNDIANLLVTLVQTNNLTIENATLSGLEVQVPSPPTPPPAPIIPPSYADIKTENNDTLITPVPEVPTQMPLVPTCNFTQTPDCNSGIQILIPTKLVIIKQPAEVTGHLLNVILVVQDNEGSVITQLGLTEPWSCISTLVYTNDNSAEESSTPIISGQVEVDFENGIAEFNRLRVSRPAEHLYVYFTTNPGNIISEHSIEFEVISPPSSWPRIHFYFKLQGDYDLIASDLTFQELLISELSRVMDVDLSRIQGLTLSSGSILVEADLLEPFETDPSDVPTATQALNQLRTEINMNSFSFSYNGLSYTAEPSSFSSGPGSTVAPPTLNYMAIISIFIGLISIILLIILIVIIVIGIRILFVTRKRNQLRASREGVLTNIYSTESKSGGSTEYQLAESIKEDGLVMMNPIYNFDSLPQLNTPATEEKFEFFAARSLDQEFCLPGTPLPPETDID